MLIVKLGIIARTLQKFKIILQYPGDLMNFQ
jgi:hypothetical protein